MPQEQGAMRLDLFNFAHNMFIPVFVCVWQFSRCLIKISNLETVEDCESVRFGFGKLGMSYNSKMF